MFPVAVVLFNGAQQDDELNSGGNTTASLKHSSKPENSVCQILLNFSK